MATSNPRIGIYPGSFDPVTNGHLDILERAKPLFDKIIVLIAINSTKQGLFSFQERQEMLRAITSSDPAIEIDVMHDGLLVHYCQKVKATAIIRGLRAVADFEYEYAITLMNRRLAPQIETIFFMTTDKYSFISSTMVKEVARLGGSVKDLVPDKVDTMLYQKMHRP